MTVIFPSRAFRRQRERTPGLLFSFGTEDLSTSLSTGQTLTYDRNGARTVFDSSGRVATLAYDQVPWSAHYNTTPAVWEPVYDSHRATTNLCLRSEDFGTTWAAVGSPTRTAAALTCGDVALDLIGDDSGAALEGYTQTVTFTGNAVKAVSLFMAAGTSTSTVIRLRDTTASANRLLAVVTWSGGVPTVAMTTGTDLGTTTCANGVYRFHFQTTSATAANTNSLEVYPASTSGMATANTGTVYAGGVMAENYDYAHAYVKTLGSTVTTVADALTCTVALPVADFTVYARLARPRWADVSGSISNALTIAGTSPTTNAYWLIRYAAASRAIETVVQDTAASTQTQSTAIPSGAIIEYCAQFTNVASAFKVRVDVGAEFGSYTTAVAAVTSWSGTTLAIGPMDGGIRRLAIQAGALTLAQMRGPQP